MSVALTSHAVIENNVGVSSSRGRRTFTAAFKRQILEDAARCTRPGEVGALLRREGLYSSHLTAWRAAADRGELAGAARRRGPKPTLPHPSVQRIAELERQLTRATGRAERAEAIVALQKKVSALLEHLPGELAAPSDSPTGRR